MANIKELSQQLRKTSSSQEDSEERIKIAFEIFDLYCAIKKRTKSDELECCRAAGVLSGIVKEGLGKRTRDFLHLKEHILPPRAVELLRSSILRMESY